MKKRILTICLAIVMASAMIFQSFAVVNTKAKINKTHETSTSGTSGYSSIELKGVTSEDDPESDSCLVGITYSAGAYYDYSKRVDAELYKNSSNAFSMDIDTTSSSSAFAKAEALYDWYDDAPYLAYAQTRHKVGHTLNTSDEWSDIITIQYNDNIGIWTETSIHINP